MKFDKIRISSFRSIINQEVLINENCIGLIGLNESGKSNILKAFGFLNNDAELSVRDKSKISKDLPQIEFHFIIDSNELNVENEIAGFFQEEIEPHVKLQYSIKYPSKIKEIVRLQKNETTFITIRELVFDCDIKIDSEIVMLTNRELIPTDLKITIDNIERPLYQLKMVLRRDIPDTMINYFLNFDKELFTEKIKHTIKQKLSFLKPQVIFWEYDTKYL